MMSFVCRVQSKSAPIFVRLSVLPVLLAGLILPTVLHAQVSYIGSPASQNFGSEAVSSPVAVQLPFEVPGGATVGSIEVVTKGAPNLDFINDGGGTCAVQEYSSSTACTVEVTFTPLHPGLRQGAVLFWSGAGNTGTLLNKTLVYGVGTNAGLSYVNGTVTTIGPTLPGGITLQSPNGITFDGAGNMYIADFGSPVDGAGAQVVEIPAAGGNAVVVSANAGGTALLGAADVQIDGAGDIFIADQDNARVVELPVGGALTALAPTVNGTLVGYVNDALPDPNGVLYITDNENNRLIEMQNLGAGAGTQITAVDGMNLGNPAGLSLDSADNLFIGDQYNNRVAEILAGGGSGSVYGPAISGVSGDLSDAYGVLVDAANNLFITDFTGSGRLIEIPAGSSAGSVLAPTAGGATLTAPSFMGTDDAGNFYVADYGTARVFKIARSAPTPMLAVSTTSSGTFTQGSTGQWNVTVINEEPSSTTSGTVTVADTLPSGSTLSSYSGSGWSCSGSSTVTCTSTSSVSGGSSYAQIQLIVNIPADSAKSVTNNVVAFGGGDTAHTNATNGATAFSTISVVQVAASITISGGNNQSTMVSTAFPMSLSATVLDAASSPIVGASVTFTAPSSGASGAFSGSLTYAINTGAGGVATATAFTANSTPGAYSVGVTSGSASNSFSLTNNYVPVATSYQFATLPSSKYVGQSTSITVTAYDQFGALDTSYNANANITSSDGAASYSTPVTFASGTVSFNVTFRTTGTQTVTVTDASNGSPTATTSGIGVSIPNFVVNVTLDDSGSASNCALQTTSGITTNSDNCSLRDALLAAAADGSGSISFDSTVFAAATTISLTNNALPIAGVTSIAGPISGSGYGLTNLVTIDGGGIDSVFMVNSGATATISDLVITGGVGNNAGGIVDNGTLTVIGSTITGNNAAANSGGAISGGQGASLTVIDSTLSNNTASVQGGAIFMNAGSVAVTNSTISGNNAGILGGGIMIDAGAATVTSSTIANNVSGAIGGGIENDSGTLTLNNTVVVGNTASTGPDVNGAYSGSGNQVGTGFTVSALGNYGGPTQTMVPLPGSLAICTGTTANAIGASLSTDQRGLVFDPQCPANTVDSGAVQSNYAIGFSTDPAAILYTDQLPINPAPVVSITESNVAASFATGSVTVSDTASALTGTTTSSIAAGAATFTNLLITGTPSADHLIAMLSLNPALNPALALSTQSTGFQVGAPSAATLIAPVSGSTFTGTSATFTWTNGGAGSYYLLIGTQGVGSNNLYNSAPKSSATNSYTFTRLPLTGGAIYVRLTSVVNGSWVSKDYQFTAAGPATITSPANASALSGASATFNWSAASGATGYYLWIGTQGVGSSDLYYSGQKSESDTSFTFTKMPVNGEPIYVRLITNYNGTWVQNDYQYTAGTVAGITAPSPLSTLPGSSATFTWTAGAGATGYYLLVGTQGVGSNDIYNSTLKPASTTSYTVTNLPAGGQTIYVRLSTNFNGMWVNNDYQYTAATGARLTMPVLNSTFTGATATFAWTAAANANGYYLKIGSTPGGDDIYDSMEKAGTSYTFTGLPTDGRNIYVRLYTAYTGTWTYNDYQFTAAN